MNKYNPHIHHRHSIRLKGYDYAKEGLYFITICVQDRQCLFGEIRDDKMILNEYGEIAHNEWLRLSERYPHAVFDVFQIMPNHIHAIIVLDNAIVGATLAVAHDTTQNDNAVAHDNAVAQNTTTNNTNIWATARVAPTDTIGNIVGAYKSLVSNGCLKIYKQNNQTMGKLWQRNYYEHIIRNEQTYQRIAEYIKNNPQNWDDDKLKES